MKTNLTRTLVASLVVTGALALAPSAGAAITCTFETDLLHIEMDAQGDAAHLEIGGGGTILVNNGPTPVLCGPGGPPTVINTETVAIVDNSDDPQSNEPLDGNASVRITNPAAFAPGATLNGEGGGTGEIEFAINMNAGSNTFDLIGADPGADNWVMGAAGVNLNAGAAESVPDVDLSPLSTIDAWFLLAGGGNDVLSARGGSATGSPLAGAATLSMRGEDGNDVIEGGDRLGFPDDAHLGGPGDDVIRGFGGEDAILPDLGNDTIDGGSGSDGISFDAQTGVTADLSRAGPQDTGVGTKTIVDVEEISGTGFADTLTGNAAPNKLFGNSGDDTLDGRAGDDLLSGSSGTDTVTFADAPAAVTANLTIATSTGDGSDTLADEIENLVGSPFADTLIGSAEANSLTGLGGADTISALAGPDTVDVRDGGRDVASCGSEIDSALADQEGVDAIDPDCETVAFAPADGGGGAPSGGGGAPSNAFSFGKAKKNKRKGTAKLTVNVPGAGGLELAKTTKVKGDDERAATQGSVTLTVKSKGKAKKKLTNRGRAKVNAEVTYTPDGGTPNTESTKIKLVKKTLAAKARR